MTTNKKSKDLDRSISDQKLNFLEINWKYQSGARYSWRSNTSSGGPKSYILKSHTHTKKKLGKKNQKNSTKL